MLSRRLLLGAALAAPLSAQAATWPAKPIRVILPGPAGGLIDIASRAIGDAMQKELGQTWLGAHLLPELIKIKYDIDVTSISYKGLPPGVQDLLGGRLDLAMVSTALVLQHVKAGRLKALAVIGPKRLTELPDVATMAEQGAGEAEVRSMLPLYGQKALPDAIVVKVSEAVQRAQADSETRQRLAAAYIEPMPLSPAETAIALAAEHERLGRLIQQLGIRADGTG